MSRVHRAQAFHWLVLAAGGLQAGTVLAAPDSCDDYAQRHYRKFLEPLAVTVQDMQYEGDILDPHEDVAITVRNGGEVALGEGAFNYREVAVDIAGRRVVGVLLLPLAPGAQEVLHVTAPVSTFAACADDQITVDADRSLGQWGCEAYSYNTKTLTAEPPAPNSCIISGGPIRHWPGGW